MLNIYGLTVTVEFCSPELIINSLLLHLVFYHLELSVKLLYQFRAGSKKAIQKFLPWFAINP